MINVPLEADEDALELKSRKEYLGSVEGGCKALGSKRTDEVRLVPSWEVLRDPSVDDIGAAVDAESLRDDPDRRQNLLLAFPARRWSPNCSSTGTGSSFVI